MPDDLDNAQNIIELVSAVELAYRRPVLKPCGACYFCGEQLPAGMVFCHSVLDNGDGCAQDFDRRTKSIVRQGL